MKKYYYIFTLIFLSLATLLFSACGGSKEVEVASRYKRKPIVETTERELRIEGAMIDATTQQLLGNREEAVRQYLQILRDTADYASAHYEVGRLYLAMGWTDSALVHTLQACRLNPDNEWYQLLLTGVYGHRQDGKNLVATWENIIKRNPNRVDYYYDLSNAYLLADNVQGSIGVLDRVESRFGVTEAVSLQKQKLWMAIGKPDKARKELERLADALPGESRYNAILAESHMAEKSYAKALPYYERILASNPEDENIHISLASCYLAMRNLRLAFGHLRQGLANKKIDCSHKLTFLVEFMRDKDFFNTYSASCYLLADTLAAECGDEGDYHFVYGQLLAAQERYGEAVVQFRLHLDKDKSQYAIWDALLICELRSAPDSSQLLEEAKRASELFPLHIRPYMVLAQCYLSQGDCKMAKQYIGRGLMVSPNDIELNELEQKIKQLCQESAE